MSELTALLNNVRARLDQVGVPFVVGGAFALAAHGHPRFTGDLDLMILTPSLDPVHRAFQLDPYVQVNELTFQHAGTGLYLDLFPVEDEAQRAAFDGAEEMEVYGAKRVKVLTPEGLVLMLLREATQGDPDKRSLRLRDIELLAGSQDLAWGELRGWSERMGYQAAYRDLDVDGKPEL